MEEDQMDFKEIKTDGMQMLQPVKRCHHWYYAIEDVLDDLCDAEEAYIDGDKVKANRLMFVSYPDGTVYEPIQAASNQYFSDSLIWKDAVFFMMADFARRKLFVFRWLPEMEAAEVFLELDRDSFADYYNLWIEADPLVICRRGADNRFQMIWPDPSDFEIGEREGFISIIDGQMAFSQWFEDDGEDYRYWEEVVLRKYPTGEVLERYEGSLMEMPDGQRWLVT
jgi:hypothetical protein